MREVAFAIQIFQGHPCRAGRVPNSLACTDYAGSGKVRKNMHALDAFDQEIRVDSGWAYVHLMLRTRNKLEEHSVGQLATLPQFSYVYYVDLLSTVLDHIFQWNKTKCGKVTRPAPTPATTCSSCRAYKELQAFCSVPPHLLRFTCKPLQPLLKISPHAFSPVRHDLIDDSDSR